MPMKIHKFADIFLMELHLNGALIAGDVVGGIAGLEGLTVIFTAPAVATHTFAAPANGSAHTLQEIKTALQATVAGLTVFQKGGKLVLQGTTGVTITGGTALSRLGIGAGGTAAKVYTAPGGAAPSIVSVYGDANGHVLVAKE